MAREGKGIEEKKKWAMREAERLQRVKKADEESKYNRFIADAC